MAQAARLRPDSGPILHDLGLTCLEAGRLREAEAALRRAAHLMPKTAEVHWRLGVALDRLENFPAAVEAYSAAVRLRPGLGEAHFRLGILLQAEGRPRAAKEHLRKSAVMVKDRRLRRLAEARALSIEGRDAEARALLRRGLISEPNDVAGLEFLGSLLTEAGEFEEAAGCFESALSQAPEMAGSYYELARCRKIAAGDPIVARMESARGLSGLSDLERHRLELAIGKAYDDLGDYPRAMAAFDSAEDKRRRLSPFDLGVFEALVDRIERAFPGMSSARGGEFAADAPKPVFIVGLPRSGTTLCEQILSNHPKVFGAGELPFWGVRGRQLDASGQLIDATVCSKTGQDYAAIIRELASGSEFLTDKAPFNFLWAGLIARTIPAATIVHMRRHPIDTALSIHQTYFSPRIEFPTGGQDLVRYYRLYERITEHWRATLSPERFVEVDYEALTGDPETTVRRILHAVGLEWDADCLRPESNHRVVRTPSKWQAKQPINQGSVDRWKRYEPWLGPLAELKPA